MIDQDTADTKHSKGRLEIECDRGKEKCNAQTHVVSTQRVLLHLTQNRTRSVGNPLFSMGVVPSGRMYRKLAILLRSNKNKLIRSYSVSPLTPRQAPWKETPSMPLTVTRAAKIEQDRLMT